VSAPSARPPKSLPVRRVRATISRGTATIPFEEAMELEADAKKLIKEQVDELLKSQTSTLQELAVYRWALRTFFAAVLGGSIFGVLKFQDFLDSRISARSEHFEDVYFGIAQANSDPEVARQLFDNALSRFDDSVFKPGTSFRSHYFYNFIFILADTYEQNADRSWTGKSSWDRLNANAFFKRDFAQNWVQWNSNPDLLNAWARCLIKYDDDKEVKAKAHAIYERALTLSQAANSTAADHFSLAMLDLVDKKFEEAAREFQAAEEASPGRYAVKDMTSKPAADIGNEYRMWDHLARRYGNEELDSAWIRAVNLAKQRSKR
jgi:hypothetical protein